MGRIRKPCCCCLRRLRGLHLPVPPAAGRPIRLEPGMLLPISAMACFTLMLSHGFLHGLLLHSRGAGGGPALYRALHGRGGRRPHGAGADDDAEGRHHGAGLCRPGHGRGPGPQPSRSARSRGRADGAAGLVLVISLGESGCSADPLVIYLFASLLLVVPVGLYLLGTGSFHLPPTRLSQIGVAGATLFFLAGNLRCGPFHAAGPADSNGGDPQSRDTDHHRAGGWGAGRRLGIWQLAGAALVVAAIMALTVLGRRSR